MIMATALFVAASFAAAPARAHVLFISPAEVGASILEQSDEVRDSLMLSWLEKGIAPLSRRWFRTCRHLRNLDAMELCVRPILRDRLAEQNADVIVVLAVRPDLQTMRWRCLGSNSASEVVLRLAGPLPATEAAAASRCLHAAANDRATRVQ